MIKQPDDMIHRLRSYRNGVHGAFFLEVADFLGGYDLLKASFEANADETIALRSKFEELWRVKTDLENDVARLKTENRNLTDHADLMVDEFKRIKAFCYDKFLHNTEIAGLCDRAITNTIQRVPVVLQRDQAEQRATRLQMVVDKIARVVSGEDQVADDDTEGMQWIQQYIAESV